MTTNSFDIVDSLSRIVENRDLTRDEARAVLDQIMGGGATPAQIGAFLTGMRMKGETVAELAGAAEAMRAVATKVTTQRSPLLDTCGTGGDSSGSYNISTAVAIVAAGAGVAVAKHGNRSVSSKSGSADVLESLGVKIDLDANAMGTCLDEVGLAFLFAPVLHGAMKHAIGPRRELKLRTLFNLLGPLTNPAGARRQLLGVFDKERARSVAGVLQILGTEHAWVVHGLDGLDELSILGPSVAFEVRTGVDDIAELEVTPESAGLTHGNADEIRGGDPAENARWLRSLLENDVQDGSRSMVVLNSAAALIVAGAATSLEDGAARAEESLSSGRALSILELLKETSQKL